VGIALDNAWRTCGKDSNGQHKHTNEYIVELLDELLEILGVSSLYEGIVVPEEFDVLSPSWRAWYLFRAGGDRGRAVELFKQGDEDHDFEKYEKFMEKEVSPLFVIYLLREIISDIILYFDVKLKES